MRYSSAIVASAALVAGANAWGNVTYVTEVVTAFTTYCPSATEITHGTKTYTITEVSKIHDPRLSVVTRLDLMEQNAWDSVWTAADSNVVDRRQP